MRWRAGSSLTTRERLLERAAGIDARQLGAEIGRGVDVRQRIDAIGGVAAAVSIASALGALPASAASTALARKAFAPKPVTPTRALSQLPFASSVTIAATPTIANPEAGWRCLT